MTTIFNRQDAKVAKKSDFENFLTLAFLASWRLNSFC